VARAGCYFASVITAALAQLIVPPLLHAPPAPTIGASGGVFGLLLAYAMMFPQRKVIPLIPPIPMPAWVFATLYAAAELFFGVTGTLSGSHTSRIWAAWSAASWWSCSGAGRARARDNVFLKE
jgi:membrane associated rhomboid family serine protease